MFKKLLLLVLLIAPLSLFAQKFAHFNSNDVLAALPAFKTAQTELENLGKQYQSDIEAMQKEYQNKLQKYQAEVNDKTPANMRERKEKELMDLRERIEQAVQDNQANMQKAIQDKMKPINEKVLTAINAVIKEGGYVYAIDKVSVQGVTINEALSTDITAQLKTKLGIK